MSIPTFSLSGLETDPIVMLKKEAAIKCARNVSDYVLANVDKSWCHVLISSNTIAQNMTTEGLM